MYEAAGSIAKDLADLLDSDVSVINAYIALLFKGDNSRPPKAPQVRNDYKSTEIDQVLLTKALADGMIIATSSGYIPLHPRMALSNLYRLSCARNPNVRRNRPKIDVLVAKLIRLWEDNRCLD